MKKKKMKLVLLLCWVSIAHIWAAEDKALIVELASGGQTTFVLSAKPTMTFANQALRISVSGTSTSFEIDDVKRFYFDDASTGISVPKASELKITQQSDDVWLIDGLDESDRIRLYAVDGKQHADRITTNGHQATVSLTALPKGIYLINVSNKQTFKIHRK